MKLCPFVSTFVTRSLCLTQALNNCIYSHPRYIVGTMQAQLNCFRATNAKALHSNALASNVQVQPRNHEFTGVKAGIVGTFGRERRQVLRPSSATPKIGATSSQTSISKREQKRGRNVAPPLPTGDDDILMVPSLHLYKKQLEKHDIFTLSDFLRAHQKEKSNFRGFLQDKIGMRDESHHRAVDAFLRCITAPAPAHAAAVAALAPPAVTVGVAPTVAAGMTTEQVTLSVEGNISAGKTTFLSILHRHLLTDSGFSFIKEPIEQWQSVGGSQVNLLDLFYRDPSRMAYTFQNFVFLTRVMQERDSYGCSTKARLLERSVFSDRMVFVRAVHASCDLADHELAIYDAWFGPILASLPTLVPNGLIYLRASPETCMDRLRKRARSEEGGIPLQYLQCLHHNHEDWLLTACTRAEDLRQQLLSHARPAQPHPHPPHPHPQHPQHPQQQQQQQQQGEGSACVSSLSQPPSHPHQPHHREGAVLRPLAEAPPAALAEVGVPESLRDCLYIIDATRLSQVPPAAHLHQLPSLVLDCDGHVDVEVDTAHGERISGLIRDYTSFVAAYRSARHRLAAAAAAASTAAPTAPSGLLLPPPATEYFTTDPTGRVTYRPVARPAC